MEQTKKKSYTLLIVLIVLIGGIGSYLFFLSDIELGGKVTWYLEDASTEVQVGENQDNHILLPNVTGEVSKLRFDVEASSGKNMNLKLGDEYVLNTRGEVVDKNTYAIKEFEKEDGSEVSTMLVDSKSKIRIRVPSYADVTGASIVIMKDSLN